jgi:PAS domain S-box-containing protein
MWVFDLETSAFLALNEAAVRHYGYSREDFLKMTIADIHPSEDATRLAAEKLHKINGLRHLGEWRHRTAADDTISVDVTVNVTSFAGAKLAWCL